MWASPDPTSEACAAFPSSRGGESRPTEENRPLQISADSSSRGISNRGAPEKTVTIQPSGVQAERVGQKTEEPGQLLGLEVRAEAPVSEHLEEGRVPVVSDLVDVLGAKARLGVDETVAGRVRLAQEIGDQRLHPRAGEERRRVLPRDQARPRDDRVPAGGELIEVGPANSLAAERRHRAKIPIR